MENDSLVSGESDSNNINPEDEESDADLHFFIEAINSRRNSSKIFKTIIVIFLILFLFFVAQSSLFSYNTGNLLEYKVFHFSEVLENFYDSIELFFYKSKPRTEKDYILSYKTIKDYFERNHMINRYMNMTYFFEEFSFLDLSEISNEINNNITNNINSYQSSYQETKNENELNIFTEKTELSTIKDTKTIDNQQKYFNSSSITNNYNASEDYFEAGNKIQRKVINQINEANTQSGQSNENLTYANNYDNIFSFNNNNKNLKIKNKLQSSNKSNDLYSHSNSKLKNKNNDVNNNSYHKQGKNFLVSSDNKLNTKIQLVKNLIEMPKKPDLSPFILSKNSHEYYNSAQKKIMLLKDLANNIFINSYLSYYNKKFQSFKNFEKILNVFINNKSRSYSSFSAREKKVFKREYKKKLLNLQSLYKKNLLEHDEEYYFKYNKELNYKFLYFYYLMNNFTSYDFKGRWYSLDTKTEYFSSNGGKLDIEIIKNLSKRKILSTNFDKLHSLENSLIDFFDYFRNLEFTFYAIDGDYKNNWMIFNFTLRMPENFTDFVQIYENKEKLISISSENVEIKYIIGEFLETKKKCICQNSTVILNLINTRDNRNIGSVFKSDAHSRFENFTQKNSSQVSYEEELIPFFKLQGKIKSNKCAVNLEFKLDMNLVDVKKSFL